MLSGMPGPNAKAALHRCLQAARDVVVWKLDGIPARALGVPG